MPNKRGKKQGVHAMLQQDPFRVQYGRAMDLIGAASQAAFGAAIGLSQSSISFASRKGKIPSEWLILLFDACRANPDYIRYGVEPKQIYEGMKPLQPVSPDAASVDQLFHAILSRYIPSDLAMAANSTIRSDSKAMAALFAAILPQFLPGALAKAIISGMGGDIRTRKRIKIR